mmetsp:Transcript_7128/g.10831  ORF Transcript_7128/g.10831 Transcript_7128/m.10831 type:complete len:108 (-) Transcript_7128:2-325(-)
MEGVPWAVGKYDQTKFFVDADNGLEDPYGRRWGLLLVKSFPSRNSSSPSTTTSIVTSVWAKSVSSSRQARPCATAHTSGGVDVLQHSPLQHWDKRERGDHIIIKTYI